MAASLAPAHTEYAAHISYTMCARDLTDIYTLSPPACGPQALGVYISQIPHTHGITITYPLSVFVLFLGHPST